MAQPPQGHTRLAAAIIMAAVLVSGTLYAAVGQTSRTITSTATTTELETTTVSGGSCTTISPGQPFSGTVNVTTTGASQAPCSSLPASSATSSTTTTTTVVTPTGCPSSAICASFSYSPSAQVLVLAVEATQFTCQNCGAVNGQSYLSFSVALEDVGNSSIYIAGGTDELSVSVPSNSSIVRTVPSEVCAGTTTLIGLGQGDEYTLYGPPCDDGQDYQLVQAGTVTMTFSFDWTTSPAATSFPDSTSISAEFAFG